MYLLINFRHHKKPGQELAKRWLGELISLQQCWNHFHWCHECAEGFGQEGPWQHASAQDCWANPQACWSPPLSPPQSQHLASATWENNHILMLCFFWDITRIVQATTPLFKKLDMQSSFRMKYMVTTQMSGVLFTRDWTLQANCTSGEDEGCPWWMLPLTAVSETAEILPELFAELLLVGIYSWPQPESWDKNHAHCEWALIAKTTLFLPQMWGAFRIYCKSKSCIILTTFPSCILLDVSSEHYWATKTDWDIRELEYFTHCSRKLQ